MMWADVKIREDAAQWQTAAAFRYNMNNYFTQFKHLMCFLCFVVNKI